MAPRPKGPPVNRRQDILDAALRVFARRGYRAATNAEIASEAGVTSAALYYYFRNKQELFRAALTERQEIIAPMLTQIDERLKNGSPEDVIPYLVRNAIAIFSETRTEAVMKILLAEGPRSPELVQMWQDLIVGRAIGALLGYLQGQTAVGKGQCLDQRAMLMIVIGPIVASVITRDILGVSVMSGLTNEALAESLTTSLLRGLVNPA